MFRTSFYLAVLLVLLACTTPGGLYAQWSMCSKLPAPVAVVYFIDGPFVPHNGFAGLMNGSLYRTTDGGTNWTEVIPKVDTSSRSYVALSDVVFADSLTGWCTRHETLKRYPALFGTTDGGVNWNPLPLYGELVGLAYTRSLHRLYVSSRSGGPAYSDDGGKTWSAMGFIGLNGLAFSSDSIGIAGGPAPSGNLVTTWNAGETWNTIPLTRESYQPLALAGSKTFFLCGEHNGQNTKTQILRSRDAGMTWDTLLESTTFLGTGCIRGTKCRLFVQGTNDVLTSTDEGESWTSVSGPGNAPDTRFYYSDRMLFAADDSGEIWRYPIVPSPEALVATPGSTFDFGKNVDCNVLVKDSSLEFRNLSDCTSAWLTSLPDPGGNFAVSATLPIEIKPGDVLRVPVRFTAPTVGAYAASTKATINTGTQDVTDAIDLRGELHHLDVSVSLSAPMAEFGTGFVCDSSDQTIAFTNTSCDDLSVLSVLTPAPPFLIDPGEISGQVIPAGKSIPIAVHLQRGTSGAFKDSVVVTALGANATKANITLYLGATILPKPDITAYVKPGMISARSDTTIEIPVYANVRGGTLTIQNLTLLLRLGNTDLLTPEGFVPASGLFALRSSLAAGDSILLDLDGPVSLAGETAIGKLRAHTFVTSVLSTGLRVDRVAPSTSETCMTSSHPTDSIQFTLATSCGDQGISYTMRTGEGLFDIISVRPSPASDRVQITLSNEGSIGLFDAMGKQVLEARAGSSFDLDLRPFSSGVYFLRATSGTTIREQPIVIRH